MVGSISCYCPPGHSLIGVRVQNTCCPMPEQLNTMLNTMGHRYHSRCVCKNAELQLGSIVVLLVLGEGIGEKILSQGGRNRGERILSQRVLPMAIGLLLNSS